MFELFTDYSLSLLDEVTNPQKRVFVGYLFSAVVIALVWLCVVEKFSPVAAIKKIFDKRVWFSQSSIADFKIILINRVIMSAGAAAVVSQLTISTLLYDLLHQQTLIQPLAFHATSAGVVAILFTAFFFVFDDFSRFFVHRLMHKIPFLWAFHQVHHSAETMTPFTIFRTHPIEGVVFIVRTSIVQGVVISIFIFLFGSKVDLVTIFGASVGVVIFHSLGSNLRHSHIKIRYPKILEHIFISPGQHQIHHSTQKEHFDKNFGVAFAIWDLIFGSLAFSEKAQHKFGLKTKFGSTHSILHLYVEPFKSALNSLKRSKTKKGDSHIMKVKSMMTLRNILLAAIFSVAWLGQTQATAAAELNIYSHRQPFLIKPFLKAFTEKTGIKTNVVYASKGLVQRLLAEGEASPADVVLTVDIGRLRQYADKDLFSTFASDKLQAAIPRHLRSSDNTWFGFSKRSRIIAVSKDLADQDQIQRFENLADKRWKGRICSRPGSHVYNRALLSSIIAANGESAAKAWAEGLVTNFARSPRGNDRAQIKAIFAGECDISIVNHYYYGKLFNSSNNEERQWAESVNIIIPNQAANDRGAHINISGGGIAKYSKNREEAESFLEFLISEEAQKLYASINYEYPVISDVELPNTLEAWGKFKEDNLPIEKLADTYLEAQMIIDHVGW